MNLQPVLVHYAKPRVARLGNMWAVTSGGFNSDGSFVPNCMWQTHNSWTEAVRWANVIGKAQLKHLA